MRIEGGSVSRMDVIEAWLAGASVAELLEDNQAEKILRAEFMLMAETLSVLQASLGQLTHDLDALALEAGEDYQADPFLWGYVCGKARQAETINVVISHLANNLLVRAISGGQKE
jgi:hypothetical protein